MTEATDEAATLTRVLPRRMEERSLSGLARRKSTRAPPGAVDIRFL
jgi:hypothetical protein